MTSASLTLRALRPQRWRVWRACGQRAQGGKACWCSCQPEWGAAASPSQRSRTTRTRQQRDGARAAENLLDAIEALGIDPRMQPRTYWQHVRNHVSVGERPRPYTKTGIKPACAGGS
jgi:hypothetical protein